MVQKSESAKPDRIRGFGVCESRTWYKSRVSLRPDSNQLRNSHPLLLLLRSVSLRRASLRDANSWEVRKWIRNSHKGAGDADARIQIFRQGFGMGSACRLIGKIKKGAQGPKIFIFPTSLDLLRVLGA